MPIIKDNSKKHSELYKKNSSFFLIKKASVALYSFNQYDHASYPWQGYYTTMEFISLEDFILTFVSGRIDMIAYIFGFAYIHKRIYEKEKIVAGFSKDLIEYKDKLIKELGVIHHSLSLEKIFRSAYLRIIGKSMDGIFFKFINRVIFKRVPSGDFFSLEGVWRDDDGGEIKFNLQDKYYIFIKNNEEQRYDFKRVEQYHCLFSVCENESDLCERTDFILSRDNVSMVVHTPYDRKLYKKVI